MAGFWKSSKTAGAAKYILQHSTLHPVLEKLQTTWGMKSEYKRLRVTLKHTPHVELVTRYPGSRAAGGNFFSIFHATPQRTWEVASDLGMMLSDPPSLKFLELLLRATGAKRYLEIGVFTGLSALSAALALPPDAVVVGLDNIQRHVDIGKPFFKEAGVDHKIDMRIGEAVQSLDTLISEGHAGGFDFAFIDAGKEQYDDFYERCLKLVRKGGIIAFDNVLWQGSVYDESKTDVKIEALRKINDKLSKDERVQTSVLTVGDGITLALIK